MICVRRLLANFVAMVGIRDFHGPSLRRGDFLVIGCLHDRANIEQLVRRSMIISMLIRRAGGL